MKSKVAFLKVRNHHVGEVQRTVRKAMTLLNWRDYVTGKSIFLKLNLLSAEVVPGQCTSPWVFEGVLQEVRESFPEARIFYGDADVAASRQVDKAVKSWGIRQVGDCYNAEFVNLSKAPARKVYVGEIFQNIEIPEILLDVDTIITVPIIKTHCITPMTGALKNQWGLLPRARFQYHPVVNQAIPEINKFFSKVTFAVADMTISMEGPGPRCGTPKICDLILASPDRVALDYVAAKYMGFEPDDILHIINSEKSGIGTTDYELVGDEFEQNSFRPGRGEDYLIYRWRDRFRKVPILRNLLFKTAPYRFLGFFATSYNRMVWYAKYGKQYAKDICNNSWYGEEFKDLIETD